MRTNRTSRRWAAVALVVALAGTVYVAQRGEGAREIEVSSRGPKAPTPDDLSVAPEEPDTTASTAASPTTAPATAPSPATATTAPGTTITSTPSPVVTTTTSTKPTAACLGDAPFLAGPGIWTVSRTGEAKLLVAHDPATTSMGQVTWSPDGKHAAYVTAAAGSEGSRLRVVDLDGRISEPAGDERISHAIGWTADSQRVLFTTATSTWPPPYRVTLSAAPIDARHPAVVWEGQWSVLGVQSLDALPDGRIVFINEDKVFSVNEDGTGYTEFERVGLPENGQHYGVPRSLQASPDGTKLAVQAGGETGIIELATGKVIIKGPNQHRVLEWSPDSRWVAFMGYSSTAVLGVDGSVHTIPAGWDVTFDPHGSTLAVASVPIGPDGPAERLLLGPLDGPWEPSILQAVEAEWGPALAVAFGRRPTSQDGDLTVCVLGDRKPLVRLVGTASLRDLHWVDSERLIALTWG